MRRRFCELCAVEKEHPIRKGRDGEFLSSLQTGILMALKDLQYITDSQLEAVLKKIQEQTPA